MGKKRERERERERERGVKEKSKGKREKGGGRLDMVWEDKGGEEREDKRRVFWCVSNKNLFAADFPPQIVWIPFLKFGFATTKIKYFKKKLTVVISGRISTTSMSQFFF